MLSEHHAEKKSGARASETAEPSVQPQPFYGISDIGFYGLRSDEEVGELRGALDTLRRLYGSSCFVADMMCSFSRSFSFAKDPVFMQAVKRHDLSGHDKIYVWRLHTLVWAARSTLNLPGDFVECGVFMGYSARVIADVLEFQRRDKTFYLYDTFEGLSERYSSASELAMAPSESFAVPGLFEAVCARFNRYANVRVIKGIVPDVLGDGCPENISYLHLDMNAADAEIGALEVLFERVVPGGFLVLDDFGHSRHRLQFTKESAWFNAHGYEVLELPTGQGLVIKR